MQIFWYLLTHGGGRYVATGVGSRSTSLLEETTISITQE